MWNCNLLTSFAHQLTIRASNLGGLQLCLTIVYGSNWQHERGELWSHLVQVNQQFINGPWAVLGEINSARFF